MQTPACLIMLLLVSTAVAGCLQDDRLPSTAPIEAPEHRPGMYWSYSVEGDVRQADGEDGIPQDAADGFTVVFPDQADPTLATDSCEMEFMRDTTPLMTSPTTEAGEDALDLLQWPLEEGKSWKTGPAHDPYTVTVEEVHDGTARLTAAPEDQEIRFEAEYDADAGWFTFLQDHVRKVVFRLEENGHGHEGPTCTITEQELLEEEYVDSHAGFTIEVAEADSLSIEAQGVAEVLLVGLPAIRITYTPPDEETEILIEDIEDCIAAICSFGFWRHLFVSSDPGTWELEILSTWYKGALRVTQYGFDLDEP